jgi:hypothetical protein
MAARVRQADAEVAWLLKHTGVTSHSSTLLVALLRQTIGSALVCT